VIEIEGFMPVPDACDALGVSRYTLAYYARRGKLFMMPLKYGKQTLWFARRADVEMLVSARQAQQASGRQNLRLSLIGSETRSARAQMKQEAERLEAIAEQLVNAGDAVEAQAARLRQAAWEGSR
jgi:hypothetical protein